MEFRAASDDILPRTKTQEPIVTGSTVLGIKYADGVMIIADTLASYGSMARFLDSRRIIEVNDKTILGAGGDISDFQFVQDILEELAVEDFNNADGFQLSPKEIHSYLARVMYNKRSKIDPLWNQLVVGGFKNGKSFLGFVDLYGSSFEDDIIGTGFGAYLAVPILRKRWRPGLSFDDARLLLEETITVCFYRDCRAMNRYTLGIATQTGNKISEPFSLGTKWNYKLFINPSTEC